MNLPCPRGACRRSPSVPRPKGCPSAPRRTFEAGSELAAARLEKFHFPFGPLSSTIDGSSNVSPVMFSCFEKMSGINSTPIFRLFAVRKGDLLNAGSSAMLYVRRRNAASQNG